LTSSGLFFAIQKVYTKNTTKNVKRMNPSIREIIFQLHPSTNTSFATIDTIIIASKAKGISFQTVDLIALSG